MFGSINKTFGCCGKIFGCSNKNFIVVPNFVAVTKPFFSVKLINCTDIYCIWYEFLVSKIMGATLNTN